MPRAVLSIAITLLFAALFVQFGGVRFDSDFVAMYAAVHGVVNGVSPWDEIGQAALLNAEYPELEEPIVILPFGYPPWYVMVTFPIGWLDYARAGRAFMLLNLVWLAIGSLALVSKQPDLRRAGWMAAVAGLYLPVIGLVVVGQYTLPVFCGGALALLALHKRLPWLLSGALLLMSFKWHIGAIPAMAVLLLLFRDRDLALRSIGPIAAVFGGASLVGLALDPAWPLTYARSVLALSGADVNQVCDTCSSLAWFASTRLDVPTSIPGGLLLLLGASLIGARGLVRDSGSLLGAVSALTLLSLPYVRNYDYVLLALVLVLAAERSRTLLERIPIALCWLAPVALPFLDRSAADEVLGFSALALLAQFLVWGPRPPLLNPGTEIPRGPAVQDVTGA